MEYYSAIKRECSTSWKEGCLQETDRIVDFFNRSDCGFLQLCGLVIHEPSKVFDQKSALGTLFCRNC